MSRQNEKYGNSDRVINHMLKVNKWSMRQGMRAISDAKAIVNFYGNRYWLDLTFLNQEKYDFLIENDERIVFTDKENGKCKIK